MTFKYYRVASYNGSSSILRTQDDINFQLLYFSDRTWIEWDTLEHMTTTQWEDDDNCTSYNEPVGPQTFEQVCTFLPFYDEDNLLKAFLESNPTN